MRIWHFFGLLQPQHRCLVIFWILKSVSVKSFGHEGIRRIRLHDQIIPRNNTSIWAVWCTDAVEISAPGWECSFHLMYVNKGNLEIWWGQFIPPQKCIRWWIFSTVKSSVMFKSYLWCWVKRAFESLFSLQYESLLKQWT